jgi:hypothetical protein
MDDVALANYVAGVFSGPVEAGRLDAACAPLLGLEIGVQFWFSDYTLFKLKSSHGEINYSHYKHMPAIQLHGFLARGRHSNLIDLWWADLSNDEKAAYFVVLKATSSNEVYVSTFHRISFKETRRLWRRATEQGRLVRTQAACDRILRPKGE